MTPKAINTNKPSKQQRVVIYKAFYLDVARGRMKWAPNEKWTHKWRFASLARQRCPNQQNMHHSQLLNHHLPVRLLLTSSVNPFLQFLR